MMAKFNCPIAKFGNATHTGEMSDGPEIAENALPDDDPDVLEGMARLKELRTSERDIRDIPMIDGTWSLANDR